MQVESIIKKTAGIARQHLPERTRLVLFGSWARGNAVPTSDIDIGIFGAKKIPFETMVKIRQDVDQIPTLRKVDVVDLQLTDERFREQVLTYAKTL